MTHPEDDQSPVSFAPGSGQFVSGVHVIVATIPLGYVTTYGSIARALGFPRHARMVGWAVHDPPSQLNLPCHRVVNRDGYLSGGIHFGHPDVMRAELEAEGVTFIGEYRVDMKRHYWDPSATTNEMGNLDHVPLGE